MIDAELTRFVREEIKRQMNLILPGQSGTTTEESEDIDNLFPGMPTITERPVMHPYGWVSRAPKKTISVVARTGEHAGNRMVIGHRDSKRPKLSKEGEGILYNSTGQQVRLEDGKVTLVQGDSCKVLLDSNGATITASAIKIGSANASEPLVLGNQLKSTVSGDMDNLTQTVAQLTALVAGLTAFAGALTPIEAAAQTALTTALTPISTALPLLTTAIATLKGSQVTSGAILSTKAKTE